MKPAMELGGCRTMVRRDASVSELRMELGIRTDNRYRNVDRQAKLHKRGKRVFGC